MFPSSGLFADINCPFSKRGLCERPHCLYKHATELRDKFGAKSANYKSSIVDFAGVQNGYVVNDETKDDCLQELERINKEIETVRHEVEQEQKRLSRYQTVQADGKNTATLSTPETAGKLKGKGTCGRSSYTTFTKTYSREQKYVVDNSKPRTDLEYDPLSNFSAGIRSYSSAEPLDDSNEDSVLIIDIPPSPDKKRMLIQALCVRNKLSKPRQQSSLLRTGLVISQDRCRVKLLHLKTTWSQQSPLQTMATLFVKEKTVGEILIISSSDDDDELNYSDMELSDSDPMEECYRIFMEANENNGNEEQPDVSVGAMEEEKTKLDVKQQALPGKKRLAHEAKCIEPASKSRPQPQVLVPLRGPAVSGFSSQPCITPEIQQVQQRASMLTASVKGVQPLVHSNSQRRRETQVAPLHSIQTPESLQPAPVQNTYMNYISLGTAVIGVGNNLHLILPEGTFPLPVTSITPMQRYRTTAPVLIPAPARKPSLTSAFAATLSSPAASTTSQTAVHAGLKLVPTKRKMKQQCETVKVPHDTRQRYVNLFTEEFLKTTANVNDAFEKALAEEKAVYNRSMNKLKYMSVAVNALKKLKNQVAVADKDENEVNSQKSKGNIPLNLKFKGNDDTALYESLKEYVLSEETLVESNFPVQHPEKPGCAVLFADNKKGHADPLKRICCRCGATYSVSQTGKHIRKEECNYHYGKGVTKKVPGGVETRYSCCEGVMGAPGCQVFKLHVHDFISMDGFVSTVPRCPSDTSCPGVYSLDCEMCYTIHGLELPDYEVIDYNTRFSGISEEDLKGNHTSLREVQETLLSFISTDTILIGHGLETDHYALKLLHGTVVDTSVVFPHRLGPPHKLTLNKLTADYLRRIIQESVCGHDTADDAAACMELMLWRVKEDGKFKK
ncbi:hypothetical protein JOQ06_012418 [Pogonophryne albipinna]|uniref:Exonuclease domain-containing protein n=1 Tax=Pogonophryne albipinna TaxID=1090488 RepID=A0AAD6FPY8_9TELE|nr:hypothetical protein JOQ06_012418 [Pogonophryne albipinna]